MNKNILLSLIVVCLAFSISSDSVEAGWWDVSYNKCRDFTGEDTSEIKIERTYEIMRTGMTTPENIGINITGLTFTNATKELALVDAGCSLDGNQLDIDVLSYGGSVNGEKWARIFAMPNKTASSENLTLSIYYDCSGCGEPTPASTDLSWNTNTRNTSNSFYVADILNGESCIRNFYSIEDSLQWLPDKTYSHQNVIGFPGAAATGGTSGTLTENNTVFDNQLIKGWQFTVSASGNNIVGNYIYFAHTPYFACFDCGKQTGSSYMSYAGFGSKVTGQNMVAYTNGTTYGGVQVTGNVYKWEPGGASITGAYLNDTEIKGNLTWAVAYDSTARKYGLFFAMNSSKTGNAEFDYGIHFVKNYRDGSPYTAFTYGKDNPGGSNQLSTGINYSYFSGLIGNGTTVSTANEWMDKAENETIVLGNPLVWYVGAEQTPTPPNDPPLWSNNQSSIGTLNTVSYFNTTWTDDSDVNGFNLSFFELGVPDGSLTNYTSIRIPINVSHYNLTLTSVGNYNWTIYANDSSNAWNKTDTIGFSVTNAVPLWIGNASNLASPVVFSSGNSYGFQINWTDPNSNFDKATFEFTFPNSTLVNYTTATTPATANDSASGPDTWYINLSLGDLGMIPGSFSWKFYGIDSLGVENSSDTYAWNVSILLYQIAQVEVLNSTHIKHNVSIFTNDLMNSLTEVNVTPDPDLGVEYEIGSMIERQYYSKEFSIESSRSASDAWLILDSPYLSSGGNGKGNALQLSIPGTTGDAGVTRVCPIIVPSESIY